MLKASQDYNSPNSSNSLTRFKIAIIKLITAIINFIFNSCFKLVFLLLFMLTHSTHHLLKYRFDVWLCVSISLTYNLIIQLQNCIIKFFYSFIFACDVLYFELVGWLWIMVFQLTLILCICIIVYQYFFYCPYYDFSVLDFQLGFVFENFVR